MENYDSEESDGQFETQLFQNPSPPIHSVFLKVSVIKPKPDNYQPSTFYISSRGVIPSLRHPPDGTFKIGRQQIDSNNLRPNDLILSSADKAVSRCHCMIVYSHFFLALQNPAKISFLMATHKRLGFNSKLKTLPIEIFKIILSFFHLRPAPCLIDLGSKFGTYVKLEKNKFISLHQDMCFLIGTRFIVKVESISNVSAVSEGTSEEDALDFLDLPNITLVLSRQEESQELNKFKFIAESRFKEVFIGRSKSCDIVVGDSAVSRVQCRVVYNNEQWALADGSVNKPTANGTWLGATKNDPDRQHSCPYPLRSGDEVKISESIIQIEY